MKEDIRSFYLEL